MSSSITLDISNWFTSTPYKLNNKLKLLGLGFYTITNVAEHYIILIQTKNSLISDELNDNRKYVIIDNNLIIDTNMVTTILTEKYQYELQNDFDMVVGANLDNDREVRNLVICVSDDRVLHDLLKIITPS